MSDNTIPKTKEEILADGTKTYCSLEHSIRMYGQNDSPFNDVISCAKSAMDEYAQQQAVSFIEWAWNNGWQPYDAYDRWINTDQGNVVLPTPSVYESFLIAQTKSKQ